MPRTLIGLEVRVVSLDQVVRNGDHVASLYLYPRAIWLEALKRPRPRERRSRSPLHGGAVPRGGDVEDFQAEVGERVEQRAEVLAHSVGRDHVLLPDEVIDRPGRPAAHRCFEIVLGEGLEVFRGDVGGGHRGAAVYAAAISSVG